MDNGENWTVSRTGNIGFVDGSVQQTTDLTLQTALVNTGTATNRLVIP